VFLKKGQYPRVCIITYLSKGPSHVSFKALKLAERTIQFADTLTVLTEGYLRAGRVSHAEGSLMQATKYYSTAVEGHPKHALGAIGLAQMQMQNGKPLTSLAGGEVFIIFQTRWPRRSTL